MKRILTLAGAVLVPAMLAACSPGINTLGNTITFDSSGIVVHAKGHPDAHVSPGGDLSIGGKAIAVTPAQRQLLQSYYRQAGSTMESGEAMAKHGIGDVIGSIFQHASSGSGKRANTESQDMEKTAATLCADVKALGTTQKEIAAGIPAFAPYASGHMQCEITRGTGAKASSFHFSLREAKPTAADRGPSAPSGSAPAPSNNR